MPNMLELNPSDPTAAPFVQPDWNSKAGVGVAVPASRDASRDLTDIYAGQRIGAKVLAGGSAPAPTVATVTPTTGGTAGGTAVTITGTNFWNVSSVTFGGTAATSVRVTSTTTLTCVSPAKTAGAVTVAVVTPGGTGTKTTAFTYS